MKILNIQLFSIDTSYSNQLTMGITENNYPVVCYGEILWDILPKGAVPGGAPMNVAYNLNKLGLATAMVTRVGTDVEGQALINIMNSHRITTEYFQLDNQLPTGKVIAQISTDNEVSYNIIEQVAWDNIGLSGKLEQLIANTEYFVFGSLATRSEQSRKTLFSLIEMAPFKVFDINLRPPYYNRPLIEKLLSDVQLLKMNLAEAFLISGWYGDYTDTADQMQFLQDRFKIPNIMVTKGADGALLNKNGTIYKHAGYKVLVADTVGSGDASLAGLIANWKQAEDPSDSLAFSSALGALIATKYGACPEYDIKEIDLLVHNCNTLRKT